MNNLSATSDIRIRWLRVPSSALNDRSFERSFLTPDTEKRLFRLLHAMGLMFGGQIQAHKILHHNPKTARRILGKLNSEHKVVEHIMRVGNKDYKVYTLGPAGAALINVPYQPDYWLKYSENDTIQRLMSVDLYIRMCDYLSTDMRILTAEKPYTHTFVHDDKVYRVGVLWDNAVSFLEAYRWEPPRERVILVCQAVNQADSLLSYLEENTPIRLITREKLREGLIFYRPVAGRWALDIPDKQIKSKPVGKIVRRQRVLLS